MVANSSEQKRGLSGAGARRPLAAAIMAKSATLGVGSPNRCRAAPRRPRRTPSCVNRLGRLWPNRPPGSRESPTRVLFLLPGILLSRRFHLLSRAHRHRLSPLSCSHAVAVAVASVVLARHRRRSRLHAIAVARARTPSPSPSLSPSLALARRRHRLSLSRHLRLW